MFQDRHVTDVNQISLKESQKRQPILIFTVVAVRTMELSTSGGQIWPLCSLEKEQTNGLSGRSSNMLVILRLPHTYTF
jgi:hypothetical protein